MQRFRPYIRYLKQQKALIIVAIICGVLYGAASGAGLPLMTKKVFPLIFKSRSEDLPAKWERPHLTSTYSLTPAQLALLDPLLAQATTEFSLNNKAKEAIDASLTKDFLALLTPEQRATYENQNQITSSRLLLIVIWLPIIFFIRGIAGYFNTYCIQLAGTRVLEAIRLDLFKKLQIVPLSFFQKHSTGDLLARGLADANQLQATLTNAANEIIKSPATLIGALGYLAYTAYTEKGVILVLITMGLVPLSVLPIRYVGKKLVKRAGQIQAEFGAVTSIMAENLSAAKEVRAFNLEARETQRFSIVSKALIRVQMKFVKYEKMMTPVIEIISAAGISFTLIYAYKVGMDLETFLSIITALYASYEPIKKLGALSNDFKKGIGALDRLEEVLNEPVTIVDNPAARPLPTAQGNISFENVTFSYPTGEPALIDINVQLPAGTVCALVGKSGAGKSSFANLVPRFYDVSNGRITLDGHDVRDLRLAHLRDNIAIVSQDPFLFNDSIYENLLLGRPSATRAEVEQAARDAFAHDFILAQPEGYNSLVGERGTKLSGGQKQRIALARAFLRNAPILILDEATSALDSESEASIQLALKKLMVGKTVLIIAHRFSTIRDANRILLFHEGRIVASGSHAEIYAQSAHYKHLYDLQHQSA